MSFRWREVGKRRGLDAVVRIAIGNSVTASIPSFPLSDRSRRKRSANKIIILNKIYKTCINILLEQRCDTILILALVGPPQEDIYHYIFFLPLAHAPHDAFMFSGTNPVMFFTFYITVNSSNNKLWDKNITCVFTLAFLQYFNFYTISEYL